jgi:hypothetical protein
LSASIAAITSWLQVLEIYRCPNSVIANNTISVGNKISKVKKIYFFKYGSLYIGINASPIDKKALKNEAAMKRVNALRNAILSCSFVGNGDRITCICKKKIAVREMTMIKICFSDKSFLRLGTNSSKKLFISCSSKSIEIGG